jgi:hypothetical protein
VSLPRLLSLRRRAIQARGACSFVGEWSTVTDIDRGQIDASTDR